MALLRFCLPTVFKDRVPQRCQANMLDRSHYSQGTINRICYPGLYVNPRGFLHVFSQAHSTKSRLTPLPKISKKRGITSILVRLCKPLVHQEPSLIVNVCLSAFPALHLFCHVNIIPPSLLFSRLTSKNSHKLSTTDNRLILVTWNRPEWIHDGAVRDCLIG